MKSSYILILYIFFLSSCLSSKNNEIKNVVNEFYITYNNRNDINKLLDFYDESITLEDIVNNEKIIGKNNLKLFYDWNNPNFKSLDSNNLVIDEIIIDQHKAVVIGSFNRFKWKTTEYNPMDFITVLFFNNSNKIIKQVDWINYPNNLINNE